MTQMTTCDLHNETIIQLQRELAAANALVEALSDALDYLKGLTPQQYADLRKDAERYRWLRDCANKSTSESPAVRCGPPWNMRIIEGEKMDAAIDAAIAAKEKQ